MKLPIMFCLGVAAASVVSAAPSSGLVAASGPADVAALVAGDPANAAETVSAALTLGLGDTVSIIFAGITPATSAEEAETLSAALVSAEPLGADVIAASALAALGPDLADSRATGLATAIITALDAAPLSDSETEAEVIEVLAAFAALVSPELLPDVATAIAAATGAGDDGETLLAALGPDVATGAVSAPFGDEAGGATTLTPDSAAQDAPSGN